MRAQIKLPVKQDSAPAGAESPSSNGTGAAADKPLSLVPAAFKIKFQTKNNAFADGTFRTLVILCALSVMVIVGLIAFELVRQSHLSMAKFGFKFLSTSIWDPVAENFGALPAIYGTLVSSLLALVLAVPLSLGTALFITEICPRRLRGILSLLVELLAAIPSVIYGLWGIFFLAPLLRTEGQPFLARYFGWTGLFEGPKYGIGMLAAGIILAIMILPIITSISREVMLAVPRQQREAALALGATRWEVLRIAVLRNARAGIFGAIILGLGRAIGETMAVTMVIGNRPEIARSLFAPGYTLASMIANEFSEATSDMHLSALVEVGLVLFAITLIVNAIAQFMIWSITRGMPARNIA
ncbi:MAG: phosphate ABC transporter permease subunit PstC [Candidatus Angelobacter sp. Gp1-AA117]|nr:MAG: phosphate ABC transporter permease subunit PstC [Candidatus Angelobacter sp. Gp1-AA117]